MLGGTSHTSTVQNSPRALAMRTSKYARRRWSVVSQLCTRAARQRGEGAHLSVAPRQAWRHAPTRCTRAPQTHSANAVRVRTRACAHPAAALRRALHLRRCESNAALGIASKQAHATPPSVSLHVRPRANTRTAGARRPLRCRRRLREPHQPTDENLAALLARAVAKAGLVLHTPALQRPIRRISSPRVSCARSRTSTLHATVLLSPYGLQSACGSCTSGTSQCLRGRAL